MSTQLAKMGGMSLPYKNARILAVPEFRKEARDRFGDLEKGLFTEEEKEQMLAMVRHYDKWLVADAKGENRITLTRPEYDMLMENVRLPNRFVKLETIEVE
jgi:hypothetical protein